MTQPRALTTSRSWIIALAVAAFGISFGVCPPAAAVSVYLHVPNIAGEDSTPGFPGAMAVESLTIAPGSFSIVKRVDVASQAIASAVATGTQLGMSNVLLYDAAPSATPDGVLTFPHVFASSYLVLGFGLTEQDTFSSTTPASLFLELPGIVGESSTPGHPGVMQIKSFTLSGNTFSIVKDVDRASPALQLAVAAGTPFATAHILLYDSAPSGAPDATLEFQNVLGSSYQVSGGGQTPTEQVDFSFATVVPEPSLAALSSAGAMGLALLALRRRLERAALVRAPAAGARWGARG